MQKIIFGILVCFTLSGAASAGEKTATVLEDMFRWWNGAFKVEGAYTAEAFGKYYTEDTVMIIDGSVRAQGLDQMSRNFNRIQKSVDSVELVMPPIETFTSGNRIFTYHKELIQQDGVKSVGYVMGYAVVKDGKIAKIDFVNMSEAADRALHEQTGD